jgi:dTDP-4-dehydrorhamnose reductase
MPDGNGALELWGGCECTVNRVGERYIDQVRLTGHEERLSDLDAIAELGIRTLRYPVLWERTAPDHPDERHWQWSDERLARLRDLDIRPIVGLVHHGSGPGYTQLLDPGFAPGLAAHARAVAERYPWVCDWTPVNEPLTTARFSALYGHWYPHKRDEAAFWTALVGQLEATTLAMAEVRKLNPAARLIQTEDLGKTYSTRAVAHQASFDNQRRWLTWDLLCGQVAPGHPLFERLARFGLGDRLRRLADAPCPPDVIGVNHYLTSDRFLDHRCERYPPDRRGGNEFTEYADLEAARVLLPAPGGLEERLEEAWARYHLPLAVTECHNACTREDQMRWLGEAWTCASRLRDAGIDVRAVTAWSLLGARGWDSLLTKTPGRYESGAFDVRSGEARPTALAGFIRGLIRGDCPPPASAGEGWWRRDVRLQYSPVFRTVDSPEPRRSWTGQAAAPRRPLLITGATGTLGKALARACEWRGLDYVLTDRAGLDLENLQSIEAMLDRCRPWAVINAAGWVKVDEAELNPQACHAANATGCSGLARACEQRGVRLTGFSSDLVFDGAKGCAYVETDQPAPLNVYGASKQAAEAAVLAAGGLMIRTAGFFSPYDPHNFAIQVAQRLAAGQRILAARDQMVSPTYVPDLVDAVLDLVIDSEAGLWHVTNAGQVSWAEFAFHIAEALNLDRTLIRPVAGSSLRQAAVRPACAPLATCRGVLVPSLEDAIERFAAMMIAADFEAEVVAQAAWERAV